MNNPARSRDSLSAGLPLQERGKRDSASGANGSARPVLAKVSERVSGKGRRTRERDPGAIKSAAADTMGYEPAVHGRQPDFCLRVQRRDHIIDRVPANRSPTPLRSSQFR